MKSANAVKLAGVPVLIYQRPEVEGILASARSNVARAKPALTAALLTAKTNQAATTVAREASWGAFTNAHTNLNTMLKRVKGDDFFDARDRMQTQIDGFIARHNARKLADLEAQLAVVKAEENLARETVTHYLENTGWPTPDHKVVTDADGNFVCRLPAGREFVAVVLANRKLAASEEKYLWLETIPQRTEGRMMLNNGNLFSE